MSYFTSWDANLYLCLMSLGLPHDLSLAMVLGAKKVHRDYCLEEARDYYCDRKKWLPGIGTESCILKKNRHARQTGQFWIRTRGPGDPPIPGCPSATFRSINERYFNLRAIVDIKSIPEKFWNDLGIVHFEYEDIIRKIEPEERNDYFEWAYENHYHGWDRGMFEWVKGFHPGRWILMDMKRGETLEEIQDLEDYGAYTEETFIRSKNHIDDLLAGKSPYNR